MQQCWISVPMTDYFRENVLIKRPYIQPDWCLTALQTPAKREVQLEDGRIRHCVYVEQLGKCLRVVTLEDGVTLHNAFPDPRFRL